MNITIYRYQLSKSNWDWETIKGGVLIEIANELSKLPFYGADEESQFGFTQVSVYGDLITGLFIQKFRDFLINYHPETKEEIKESVINSGEYFFALDLLNRAVYFQAKRSKDLPDRTEINKRFRDQLIVVFQRFGLIFFDIDDTKDEVDRDKIVNIFYNEADKVMEVDLRDFDVAVIEREKAKRHGVRQTYFNPIEEYQEAMEAGAVRLALNADSAWIKAKKGASLQKDPITRAALEASRKPNKIVYEKENTIKTAFGVIESKVTVIIEGDSYDLSNPEQITSIMNQLQMIDRQNTTATKELGGLFGENK